METPRTGPAARDLTASNNGLRLSVYFTFFRTASRNSQYFSTVSI